MKVMNENKSTLSRALGRTDIIAVGFGTMVGWGWVMLSASWVNNAGFMGAMCAFILGGSIILAVGLIYSEMIAAMPLTGGEFVFAYRAMGKKASWVVGWMIALSYIGVAAWEGIALATAIDYMIPIEQIIPLWEVAGYQVHFSWAIIGVAGAVVMMLINIFGVRPAMLFQVMATAALIAVVLIVFLGGLSF